MTQNADYAWVFDVLDAVEAECWKAAEEDDWVVWANQAEGVRLVRKRLQQAQIDGYGSENKD